jgi:hypothetical protein
MIHVYFDQPMINYIYIHTYSPAGAKILGLTED